MSKQAQEAELAALIAELERRQEYDKLGEYDPGGLLAATAKQREFHKAGARWRIRMLAAGNQTGKTLSAGMEVSMHMTGRYPDWWEGYRFPGPTKWWVGGVTAEGTRDNPQRILLGEKRMWGTGTIPKDAFHDEPMMARGIPDAVDSFQVRHIDGGISTAWFKSYERGREKWQGATLHGIWDDEEPPYDIYSEGLTRLNYHKGIMLITFTPLLGMTEVCKLFFEPADDDPGRPERVLIQMDLKDAVFYTPEDMEKIEAQYPDHERRARARGLPVLGEGLVYLVHDEEVKVEPFELPAHFRRLCGLDFGLQHPTAAVWIAYDPDTDIVYIYDTYEQVDERIAVHADAIKTRGDEIWVSWPHDGLKRDAKSGTPVAELYRQKNVRMLPISARYDDDKGGPQAVDPIIIDILDRMKSGKLKVFANLEPWFRAKNRYYRKDGRPVDQNDDLMKAMAYAVMMLRYSEPSMPRLRQEVAEMDYNPLA